MNGCSWSSAGKRPKLSKRSSVVESCDCLRVALGQSELAVAIPAERPALVTQFIDFCSCHANDPAFADDLLHGALFHLI